MSIFFTFIYQLLKRHLFFTFILLSGLCAWLGYHAYQLKLEEDITKMMPTDARLGRINSFIQQLKTTDRIVVTVSLKDTSTEPQPDLLKAFADHFVASLEQLDSGIIKEISYKINDDLMLGIYNTYLDNLPIFLEEKDYTQLEKLISPEQLDTTLEKNYKTLLSPASMVLKKNVLRDPIGISPYALKRLESLQLDDNFELDDGYIITKDKKHLLCFISPAAKPSETVKTEQLISYMEGAIAKASMQTDQLVDAEYFGSATVAAGNAERIKKDVTLTVGITIIILFLFITLFFRKVSVFFILFIPVLFGGLFSLAMLQLIRGHVSAIALGAGSIILGIAIDFSIHFYNHYRHTGSVQKAIRDLSFPLTLGGVTTVGAFLSLLFVDSEALQDFGLFAAFSLVGAAGFILIFFPHIIGLSKEKASETQSSNLLEKIAAYPFHKNKYLIGFILLLGIISLFTYNSVGFESDMMKMNYLSDKTAKAEKNLNAISHVAMKSVYLVSVGKTLNEALVQSEKNRPILEKLKADGTLIKYASVNHLLISETEQLQRIKRWKNFWTPERIQQLKKDLITKSAVYKFKPDAFREFYSKLDTTYSPLGIKDFTAVQSTILDNYMTQGKDETTILTIIKCTGENEDKVFNSFVNNAHTIVFDKKFLTNRFVEIIRNNFNLILTITSLLVLIVLIVSYGSLELAFITYVPMALSWLIILGLMGLFGIKFNIINIIISTFIFGLGDDYSIFITDALQTEYKTGQRVLNNYKTAILLSATTTIIGIGVLIFAQHPALQSIGLISIIGMFSVVLVSNTIQPALFKFFITSRTSKKRVPYTFISLLQSVFAYSWFAAGCLLLMVPGFIILKVLPIPAEMRKKLFHSIRSAFAKSMIYVNFHVRKKIDNPLNENFSKPAVVICNHHSVIDSLFMQSLNPKLILMVNDWVWNNPFMGPIVRMGGFIPKAAGYEENLDRIKNLIAEGYSLVIFPQGSRSPTPDLGRFHKGAFYIAEKLNLDIVPIIFHGTAFVQGKDDSFLLKKGIISAYYLPRILPSDESFGKDFSERTKKISSYFKREYAKLREQIETVDYYFNRLSKNYIYKGPVLEWYMKIKVRLEDNYRLFESLMPKKGVITDIGCGYGFLPYMLSFMSPDRKIIGLDYDEEKITVANHCFSKNEHLTFLAVDATNCELPESDAFILSDILHYLPKGEQEKLIVKCVINLKEDGLILLRDADNNLKNRHLGTRYTEFFSTRFGFNKTKNKLEFVSGEFISNIADKYGLELTRIDNTRLTSNIIYTIKKKTPSNV